ncbi:MAG: ABC transporter ATP-binding protein [Candidatus Thorarchaeota archaeon]
MFLIIQIENLTKEFGSIRAVDNITLNIDEGEVFGFLGPNGAGKTTTIRMLSCLISKTSGQANIGDYSIANKLDQPKIRRMIGLLTENVGLYEDLSAYKNLDFFGRYYKCSTTQRKERIEYYLKELGLWDKRNAVVGSFSKGMKQKIALVRALIHDPQLLFLDEPTANLDPEAAKTVLDLIIDLKKEKRTILLNTHLLDEAQRICDRICILKTKMIAVDAPKKLMESLSGKKTVIRLSFVNDSIVNAIKKAGNWNVEINNNKIFINVIDPENENPIIADAIVSAGGKLQSMSVVTSSLEDVYLNYVKR